MNQAEHQCEDSFNYLENARIIAEREWFTNELRKIHSLIGYSSGYMSFTGELDRININWVYSLTEKYSNVIIMYLKDSYEDNQQRGEFIHTFGDIQYLTG